MVCFAGERCNRVVIVLFEDILAGTVKAERDGMTPALHRKAESIVFSVARRGVSVCEKRKLCRRSFGPKGETFG